MYDNIVPVYTIEMPFADLLLYSLQFLDTFALLFFSLLGFKFGLSLLRLASQ